MRAKHGRCGECERKLRCRPPRVVGVEAVTVMSTRRGRAWEGAARRGRGMRKGMDGRARGLEQLGQRSEEQRGEADGDAGPQVEGVDLLAEAGGEGGVVDLLDPRAVDVPDAALPDVS